MHKISVLDYRIPTEAQKQIQALASNQINFPKDRCPEDERIMRTGDAEIALVTPWEKIDKEYLDACPNLKYIGLCGTSTANVDLDELSERGIAFTNMESGKEDTHAKAAGGKEAVAEFFFMQLVRLARGIGDYQWKEGEVHQLKGRSLGIIGLGHVGQGIAHMALAYKMNVAYYSPHRRQEWEDLGVKYESKDELLESCEIVVLCSTTNVEVMGKTEFELMQPGSVLVQACGGNPFDKQAFYDWIAQDGNYAIFDMSANETNHSLYKDLPHVIFSREVAGDTYESNLARGQRALHHLKDFINSEGKS
ncbi:MAG TPA: NAD(P)-dependent oxidoreductase [Candidatus Saccharibacteria bacterium]|nr:NAD(P)-dependent oxidoreductase [Candidatus Saccharibacteria bacterium]